MVVQRRLREGERQEEVQAGAEGGGDQQVDSLPHDTGTWDNIHTYSYILYIICIRWINYEGEGGVKFKSIG